MNFAGYVPLRRGLLDHTMNGKLTLTETLVLVVLITLADKQTGSYTINAPTLRAYLPGLSKWAAQAALSGLESKQYIYREIKHHSWIAYRYWINKYIPTDGPHKHSQIDLSEVFATNDTSRLRYKKYHPETPAETPAETPNYNKKEKEKEMHKENSSIVTVESAITSPTIAIASRDNGSNSGEAIAPQLRNDCAMTEIRPMRLKKGFELREGDEGAGVYSSDGIKVHASIIPSLWE